PPRRCPDRRCRCAPRAGPRPAGPGSCPTRGAPPAPRAPDHARPGRESLPRAGRRGNLPCSSRTPPPAYGYLVRPPGGRGRTGTRIVAERHGRRRGPATVRESSCVLSRPPLANALADAGSSLVVKTPRGGYDAHGVRIVKSAGEADDWLAGHRELLAEELVPFTRELSAQVARRPGGQTAAYPVVQSVQREGVCYEVVAPAPGL